MKVNVRLKNHLAKPFLALMLLSTSSDITAQSKPSVENFKITVEKTESGIKLESLNGSAWLNLRFNIGNGQSQAIDEYGMTTLDRVSSTKDSNLVDFLFTITKTESGITLEGIEGVAWKKLSFPLSQNQKQTIDQFGMTQ